MHAQNSGVQPFGMCLQLIFRVDDQADMCICNSIQDTQQASAPNLNDPVYV